jgi:hypothetical protein
MLVLSAHLLRGIKVVTRSISDQNETHDAAALTVDFSAAVWSSRATVNSLRRYSEPEGRAEATQQYRPRLSRNAVFIIAAADFLDLPARMM